MHHTRRLRLTPQAARRAVQPRGARSGQALIESCMVLALVCLIFFGLFQVSQVLAAHEILTHAASRAARAKTVGFNRWMVTKVGRVAAIPNAGKMITPQFDEPNVELTAHVQQDRPGTLWSNVLSGMTPSTDLRHALETARIPSYLAAESDEGQQLLDYANWDSIDVDPHGPSTIGDGRAPNVHVIVRQEYPLDMPLHRTFYAADSIPLEAECLIENHYALYLDDENR